MIDDWSEDEVRDAERDILALLRAQVRDDREGIAAILDGAEERGGRGVRAIVELLLPSTADLIVRVAGAVGAIEDEHMLALIKRADGARVLLADDKVRAAVEANLAGAQGRVIGGE